MKKLCLIIMLCLLGTMAVGGRSRAVSMSVVVTGADLTRDGESLVTSAFMQRLSSSRQYVGFERNRAFLNALIKEQDYQLSGEVSEKEIRAVGRRMGVDYVTVVEVQFMYDKTCYMSGRIIELETGLIVKSCSESRELGDDEASTLVAVAKRLAYRLYDAGSK